MYVKCPFEPSYALVVEDTNRSIFDVKSITGVYVILQDLDADEDKVYHLLFSKITYNVQQTVGIEVSDVNGNLGDTVDLYSVIEDENNAPVEHGEVEYTVDDAG